MTVSSGPSVTPWRIWSTLREAIRGTRHDFTSMSVRRAVILLTIPMVLEMSMESLFAIVDIFWVSKLGPDAIATIGLTESMLSVIYAVAMGLSAGAAATVSRRVGEKDREGAATAAVQAVALGLIVSATIGVAGFILAPRLLFGMGAAPTVVSRGAGYTRIMLGGNSAIVLLWLLNAIFRGTGDAGVAMRSLWLANGINMLLDPCFIFGLGPFPEMGVTGAALATTIGRRAPSARYGSPLLTTSSSSGWSVSPSSSFRGRLSISSATIRPSSRSPSTA